MTLERSYQYIIAGLAFLLGFAIPVSTSLLDIAGCSLIVLAMLSKANRGNLKQAFKEPFVKSALFIYSLFILGILWTHAPKNDVMHMLIKMDVYLLAPFLYAIFLTPHYKSSIWYGFISATLLAASLSVISTLTNTHFFTQEGIRYLVAGKMQHVFQGHTYQNYFSGIACIWLLGLLLTRQLTTVAKTFCISGIMLCFIDAFFSMPGRTGQILFAIMLIIFFILWRVKLGIIISSALVVVVLPLCILFSPTIRAGINMANSDVSQYNKGNVQTSIGARFQFHKFSVEAIKESPLWGHGTGSFHQEYLRFKPQALTTNPHNDYLWFGVELGAIGVFSLIMLILVTCYQAYKSVVPYRYLGIIIPITYAIASIQNSFFTDRITAMAYVVLVSSLLARSKCDKLLNKING